MMRVILLHRTSGSVVVVVNATSITFNSSNNLYTVHGAYATTPTSITDISVNAEQYLVRILES